MSKGYYKCTEFDNIWSYREDTDEQLVLVLVDEKEKCFVFQNTDYVDTLLQLRLGIKLVKQGYDWFMTDSLNDCF